jgi:hypothetical protein
MAFNLLTLAGIMVRQWETADEKDIHFKLPAPRFGAIIGSSAAVL